MNFDITNFASGLAGGCIGALASFGTTYLQHRLQRVENAKQREHELLLQKEKEHHDRDMQRRTENIKNTGIASLHELGGG